MRAERDRGRPGERATSNVTAGDKHHSPRRAVLLVDDEALTIKGHGIHETLRPAGYRVIYGGTIGGWYLPRHRRGLDRLGDVLAVLENAGYKVRVVEAEPWGTA